MQNETLVNLVNNLIPRVKALEHKIIVLGQTDWFEGIDDEVLSIKCLTKQIERVLSLRTGEADLWQDDV